MSNYIIIISSTIESPVDLQNIEQAITGFPEISAWSVDLEDCDKILRVSCSRNISVELAAGLTAMAVNAEVLEVFDEKGRSIAVVVD
ncbi:hypothetical protein QG516_02165 [Pedobacter gandavensis]|uniref:hypothetical protein n=1 Tax=Pedobacter gandavensis TaxID=2679963 RepID=UPI0024798763|nr:hypothetical protein [Pedobacter gandavensis]WGQ10459.1 hypothetical protein QG516_02165 [Pedobacter gandavensis]